ncbi:MAG: aldehyde dehydrogenase family protein [Gemmatimonadetes bacterium]|nr:aldehyde dehydrogenase family protein [Gemmatimonadota bacterium]
MSLPQTSAPSAQPTTSERLPESRDPATGEVWRRYPVADAVAVRGTVARARAAQPAWAALSPSARADCIRRFVKELLARRDEAAGIVARENGKPVGEALGVDVGVTLALADHFAVAAPRFLRARWRRSRMLAAWRKRVALVKEPFGVVGVISPWNYPMFLPLSSAIPALLCGNAVVNKPSEWTPGIAELVKECLHAAGVPADVYQVVHGAGAAGAALCEEADKIFFTGSEATGRKVAVACARRLIPCALELGGSDPAIVLADADLRHAASGIAWGRFTNAGQTCVAAKRVFVEEPVYDEFLALLTQAVRQLRVGPGTDDATDVGPMIRPEQRALIAAQHADALARGAREALRVETPAGDCYFPPTILTDVPPDSRAMTEETFGPLLPVTKVRDAEEAIARANDTTQGLSASVWTADVTRGIAIAQRLQAGSVLINDACTAAGVSDVPHGGFKASGLGKVHGELGLQECVRTKAVTVDWFQAWRQPWWFGYGPEHRENVGDFLVAAHGTALGAKLRALPGVLRLVFSPKRKI